MGRSSLANVGALFFAGLLASGVAGGLAGCLAASEPSIQTGPDAVTTPDGLYLVDHVPVGGLYIKPDYRVGTYGAFVLGRTAISFAEGSRQLNEEQQAELIEIFEEIARETIQQGGTREAEKLGPCVARVNLRLENLAFAGATGVASLGAVTLVMEIRDGYTGEPLLTYGQRRKLGTGSLSAAFKRFASRFQGDFTDALPPPDPARPPTSCDARAGAAS